ncbi:MAG TPA: fumarylacetoacetate hydrolase family protein [Microbacteriaceae bacterium]|nr:fumarylacetoacetate hydrolase family protein [Microbacteriaceae bacterium]
MKVARFSHGGTIRFGILDDDALVVLSGDPMYAGWDTTGERIPLGDAQLLAPVIPRSKIVCVGKNYADHVTEMGGGPAPTEPLLFFKPNTAVIGPGDAIVRPRISDRVDFEGELAIVIGAVAKHVREEDADSVIFGYTIANDVTARDLQERDGQWARAKGFDTFCPLGPVIETEFDRTGSRIETRLNGAVRQSASFDLLMFDIPRIVAAATEAFTMLPGDIILTGTPAGIGSMTAGDEVEVTIDGIGTLRNRVVDAS